MVVGGVVFMFIEPGGIVFLCFVLFIVFYELRDLKL